MWRIWNDFVYGKNNLSEATRENKMIPELIFAITEEKVNQMDPITNKNEKY